MKMGIKNKMIIMFTLLISIPLIVLGISTHKRSINIIDGDLKEPSI